MKLRSVLLVLFLISCVALPTYATSTASTTQPIHLPLVTVSTADQLAYALGTGGGTPSSTLHIINADGTGDVTLTTNYASQPTWAPDGSKLAFVCADTPWVVIETPRALCVMQADGTQLTKLTSSPILTTTTSPDWSPDGTRLLFSATTNGFFGTYHIYSINVDGSDLKQLTDGAANDVSPAWSPDGMRIAFASEGAGTSRIYLMNADGSNRQPLTDATYYANQPSWSPDGTRLVWQRNGNGTTAIMVMHADGTMQQQLLEAEWSSGYELSSPVWSPDGNQIAYSIVVMSSARSISIYSMRSDGTGSRFITAGGSPAWRPRAS